MWRAYRLAGFGCNSQFVARGPPRVQMPPATHLRLDDRRSKFRSCTRCRSADADGPVEPESSRPGRA